MDNATETRYAPAWVSEPGRRGTWSILYSCIFTLSICVWSAIHLNIPPKREPNSYQYWRKTKWVFVAIFAPEAVLYSAWQQFYLARRFIREMQNLCRDHHKIPRVDPRTVWEKYIDCFFEYVGSKMEEPEESEDEGKLTKSKKLPAPKDLDKSPSPPSEKEKQNKSKASSEISDEIDNEIASFSMTYGFYVVMGGFVVNTSDVYDHENAHWLTVTPRGVIELAQTLPWEQFREHFSIDEGSIKDKSKADCLTKILVIVQVTWAALNSLSRLTLGYPITVLEIHTLVHAGCAMLMYILWFQKPLDIRDPNPVNTASFKDKLALMLVRSPGTAYWPYVDFKLPSRWNRSVAIAEWPDEKDASEATFLHFDKSKLKAAPQGNDSKSDTYSILPHLPELPLEKMASHEAADNVSVAESSDQADRGASGRTSVRSSSSGDQGLPSMVGKPNATKASSNHSVKQNRDRTVEQADFEAALGIEFQPARPIPTSFERADIYRKPPTKRVRQRDVQWFDGISKKIRPSQEPVPTSITLSTGEFLQSGIGPAALLTSREPSAAQKTYERYSALASRTLIPNIQEVVDRYYRPPQTRLVEVDESLKPLIDIPRPQWRYNSDARNWVPPNLKETYVHKVAAALSDKDITRWTRAANAFRTELAEEELRARNKKTTKEGDKLAHNEENTNDALPVDEADHANADTIKPPAEDRKTDHGSKLVTLWTSQKPSEAAVNLSEFCYRSRNIDFYAFGRLDEIFLLAMYVAMSYISSIYAGIHLALWNHDFPTRVEAILWKISGIALGIPAPLFVIACFFFSIYLSRWPYLAIKKVFRHSGFCMFWLSIVKKNWTVLSKGVDRILIALGNGLKKFGTWLGKYVDKLTDWLEKVYAASKLHKGLFYWICHYGGIVFERIFTGIGYSLLGILMVVFFAPLIAAGVLYCFARVYIVVESFLSLRHVPIGVYEEVSWAQYIPHL